MWSRIMLELVTDPRFLPALHGANFYSIEVVKGVEKEKRIGWPRPNRDGHFILAILNPRSDGVELKLTVGRDSGLIGDNGPLHPIKDAKDVEKDRGVRLFTDMHIPDEVFDWLEQASTFVRRKHNIT